MKKNFFLLVILIATMVFTAHAQSYEVGSNVISAGIGFGGYYGGYSYGGTQSPGLSVQYERGCWDAGPGVISLGGYLGIKSYRYSYTSLGYHYENKWNWTVIGARGAYHYTGFDNEKLDPYAGLMLSYNILSFKENDPLNIQSGSYGSTVGETLFVGIRYFFTPQIAAYAELGYGASFLSLGASFKF